MEQNASTPENGQKCKITLKHFDTWTLIWAAVGLLVCLSPIFVYLFRNVSFDFSSKKSIDEAVEVVVAEATTVGDEPYDALRGYYTGTGMINDQYPIQIELRITPQYGSGWKVVGRYAYESTLRKLGSGDASWLTLNGTVDDNGYMRLSSINSEDVLVEEILLNVTMTGSSSFNASGDMNNQLNYKNFTLEISCSK